MAFKLPIKQCLHLAERRISDAAYAKENSVPSAVEGEGVSDLVADLETQAREFLAVASEQGWDGDADQVIAGHWHTYLRAAR